METFLIRLAVAVVPLLALITAVIIFDSRFVKRACAKSRGRRFRRGTLRACSTGAMLR